MKEGRRHFNKGNAFGVILSVKATRVHDVPAVDVVLDCNSSRHGKARCYGRIWGARSQDFLKWHKGQTDKIIKVEGFYSQFKKEGSDEYLSNLVIYKYEGNRSDETPRAGFILTGELSGVQDADGGEKLITMLVCRRKSEDDNNPINETFRLYLHPKDAKRIKWPDDISTGSMIAVKGLISQMGEKDYISDEFMGEVRPYIKEASFPK